MPAIAHSPDISTLQAIVSHMAEGVIFLDRDDVIRICNPAAERIRQVRAERVLGKPISVIHPPPMRHRIDELLTSLRSGVISSSTRVVQTQGRYFENSYSAILDAEGKYLGTLLISRDITEQKRLSEENLKLRSPRTKRPRLVIHSEGMRRVVEMIEAVSVFDSTVLVTGENGTGKELVVEAIHERSRRREGPLIKLNCAAIPETLLESELFGHTRGAFTGAVEERKGKFELAHGGTLFLDEIAEIPVASQAKLLRAIQERSFLPVGGRREVRVDVRILAATNRDLTEAVATGHFREDLFYRLNVITIDVPPLRRRREDILPLAEHFLAQSCRAMQKTPRRLSPEARALLLAHPLPGNVRQLKHAMERAVALGNGELLLPDDLPPELRSPPLNSQQGVFSPGTPLRDALASFEREYIVQALSYHGSRKMETAQALGISRKSLWEKLLRAGEADPADDMAGR